TNDQAFQTTIRKRGIHADSLADRKIIGQHKLFPIPLRGLLYFAEALGVSSRVTEDAQQKKKNGKGRSVLS
ncbi:MAG: hypothetical protein V2A66_03990, partial [Pseudomonadota bacterium]